LVIEAGGQTRSGFCAYSTSPVEASISTALGQFKSSETAVVSVGAALTGNSAPTSIQKISTPATIPHESFLYLFTVFKKHHLGTFYAPR
jgi:hypothetical protein